MIKTYNIDLTLSTRGIVSVDAESKEQAREMVMQDFGAKTGEMSATRDCIQWDIPIKLYKSIHDITVKR